jgi:hypothetical protein
MSFVSHLRASRVRILSVAAQLAPIPSDAFATCNRLCKDSATLNNIWLCHDFISNSPVWGTGEKLVDAGRLVKNDGLTLINDHPCFMNRLTTSA